jgi:hypothetical protein
MKAPVGPRVGLRLSWLKTGAQRIERLQFKLLKVSYLSAYRPGAQSIGNYPQKNGFVRTIATTRTAFGVLLVVHLFPKSIRRPAFSGMIVVQLAISNSGEKLSLGNRLPPEANIPKTGTSEVLSESSR